MGAALVLGNRMKPGKWRVKTGLARACGVVGALGGQMLVYVWYDAVWHRLHIGIPRRPVLGLAEPVVLRGVSMRLC